MIIEQPPVPYEELISEGMPSKLIRNEKGDGMSVEWEKYSSLEITQTRLGPKSEYGVVYFNVGEIKEEKFVFNVERQISEPLEVTHDPKEYQSHTLIEKIPSEIDPDYKEKRALLNIIRLHLQEKSHWGLIDREDFYKIAEEALKSPLSKKIRNKVLDWIIHLKN